MVGIYLGKKVEAAPQWDGLVRFSVAICLMIAKERVLVLPAPPRIFLKVGATIIGVTVIHHAVYYNILRC